MKELLNKITNYTMLVIILLLTFIVMTMILVLLIGQQVVNSPYPWLWGGMQLLVVGIAMYFIGRKLRHVVVLPPADVEVPEWMARFIGGMRGILLAGALYLAAALVLVVVHPEYFFMPYAGKIFGGVIGGGFFAGGFFPIRMVARRGRLWLLLTLVALFFVYKMVNVVASFVPIKFKYEIKANASKANMPLLDRKTIAEIVPPGATNFNISGRRGLMQEFSWYCNISPEKFGEFVKAKKYKFEETANPDIIYCKQDGYIMTYRISLQRFSGKNEPFDAK